MTMFSRDRAIIDTFDKAGDFGPLDDGYIRFWIKDKGCLSSYDLRVIADELDRRNEQWDRQVQKDISAMEPNT